MITSRKRDNPNPTRSLRARCFGGFAAKQRIYHNPKRERGTQNSLESLAYRLVDLKALPQAKETLQPEA